MLHITDQLMIEEDTISEKFVLGAGPGGQHVNKSATAVQLRFDLAKATTLPDYVRHRLRQLAGQRLTDDGAILIQVSQHRSQVRNRAEAWERLQQMIVQAAERPKKRKPTKPSRSSKAKRVQKKRQRSQIKSLRSRKPSMDD